ncbi:hypothetical protein H6CHR_00232 [Variovorax sp. PBL-H6]|uniref:hypothetical protein n=1 Tax=Variovorax sp. PBL-H6 TaxID=434009 RepID=UPI001318102E|nr:hypothetical protein [Variovorax sp. PBL-H6]VTU15443.1 hypothetical protein H6CHR_00232 [Variovorax sp. PBL-H6]
MQEHETNTGWWTEKPGRIERPSSYASLGGSSLGRTHKERVWLKALLVIALAASFGFAILRLAAI